ncbi:MAG: glycosyltransferase family 4 protein [Deltaproteobacteria bacterium]|nr:glycosyltransferase family 4 protein [Deltaproteobacteria bacterium]
MKILIATPELSMQGGVANFFRTIRPFLGDEAEFFTVGSRSGRESVPATMMRMAGDLWRFRSKLRSGGHDVVHLNPSFVPKALVRDGMFVLAAALSGKRVLVFFHGWDVGLQDRIEGVLGSLFRATFFRADTIAVLASRFADFLRERGFERPVIVETTAVDEEVFRIPEDELRRDTGDGKQGNAVNVLFLSRVEAAKGVFAALDAFARVRSRLPRVRLLVAGEGPDLEAAKRRVADEGVQDVEFLGYVRGEEKERLFLKSDIYLFPTFYPEGLPISLIEAMAYGLPAVTRPAGGVADFFEHGNMGFMSESEDAGVFADFLEKLVRAPARRREIGAYNRGYAAHRFAASLVARRLLETYGRMIGGAGSD